MRFAPNKLQERIKSKLSSKTTYKTLHNAPWFYYLIKDLMRLSMVFKNERDIVAYLQQLSKVFGEDLDQEAYFTEYDVFVRVKEVKNLF